MEVRGNLVDPPFEWKDEEAKFSLDLMVEDPNSYIEGWFGGEALLKIDGKLHGQLNRLQRRSWIWDVADGEVHEIEVTVVPRGLFGEKEDSTFREAFLVVIDKEIDEVARFAEVVADLAGETDDERLARALMNLLEDFLSSLRIPATRENTSSRLPWIRRYLRSRELGPPLNSRAKRSCPLRIEWTR